MGCIRCRNNGLGLLLATVILSGCAAQPKVSPASRYMSALKTGIARSRAQMPAITRSAEEAAGRVVGGGKLWIGGSQHDLAAEAVERAGGLMGIKPVSGATVRSGDVVLIGARSGLTREDLKDVREWRKAGAEVVAFASSSGSTTNTDAGPNATIDCGSALNMISGDKIIPVDTVLNVIDLWAWTGEFTAACTRLGKSPVFYMSYHLPGGREWAERNRGRMFHSDIELLPVAPGLIAARYLEQVERTIDAIESESSRLREAGQWLRGALSREPELYVMAHLYPGHFQDARAPQLFKLHRWPEEAARKPSGLTFLLGYQNAPDELIDRLNLDQKLIYTSVRATTRPVGPNVLYVDPHWPRVDGCCRIEGYPVSILPSSAVAQAAIYWSVMAEATAPER